MLRTLSAGVRRVIAECEINSQVFVVTYGSSLINLIFH